MMQAEDSVTRNISPPEPEPSSCFRSPEEKAADIPAQRRKSSSQLLGCLAALSSLPAERMNEAKLLDRAALLIGRALQADDCRIVKTTGTSIPAGPQTSPSDGGPSEIFDSLAAYACSSGAPVIADTLATETRFAGTRIFDRFGLSSAVAVTIPIRGKSGVVLQVFSRSTGSFCEDHADFLQCAADIIASGIERTLTEKRLREARGRLSQLISSSAAVIYSLKMKGKDLEPAAFGDNLEYLTGYPVYETRRRKWWQEHMHTDELLAALDAGSADADSRTVREYTLRRSDGRIIWLRDESRILVSTSATSLEIVGLLTDITEQKLIEEQARHAQTIDAFGIISKGVAHAYNNCLGIISGFAQLELARTDLRNPTRRALEMISDSSTSAIKLTAQLSAFGRHRKPALQTLDPGALVETLSQMVRRVIGAHIHLRIRISPDLPPVRADAEMIEQFLSNLVTNACDAMPNGGDLEIDLDSVVVSDESRGPDGRRPGRFVRLEVADTGCGMTPEIRARIFEPFFTTNEAGKGAGLGLPSVEAIVWKHGGWIDVESESGRGSKFSVFLPTTSWKAGETAEPFLLSNPLLRDSTILLLEENAPARLFIEMFLLKRGYKVVTADSFSAAEAILARTDLHLDLLIAPAVRRGSASAFELATQARKINSGLRVIYMGRHKFNRKNQEPHMEEGLNFVRKPIHLDRLATTIESCLKALTRVDSL
jgi:two-component system, cell cycle sensor histidine kinase and response regulator CckA